MEQPNIEQIPIYKWQRPCWHRSCQKPTTIVTYDVCFGWDKHIGDIPKIDAILIEKYPHVKKVFSKTMAQECVANICEHCGQIQGNFFILEELLEKQNGGSDLRELIDVILEVPLTKTELGEINDKY